MPGLTGSIGARHVKLRAAQIWRNSAASFLRYQGSKQLHLSSRINVSNAIFRPRDARFQNCSQRRWLSSDDAPTNCAKTANFEPFSAPKFVQNLSVGDTLHGFQVEQIEHVKSLDLLVIRARHLQTGAEHLHIANDDRSNAFSIGFNTLPEDSTGLPHILEHTTLCGSKRYPVRDPFFKMMKRSLVKYMNAMTAPDHTMYPFSTTNKADMQNLRSVYLDAVLSPLLRELDFAQEGWRLERDSLSDPASPLKFKGVVYNEMKGYVSDASYCFYAAYFRTLFQGTIYANDSGGDPQYITDLKHEDLVDFHRKHYHPSNSKTVTYGDGDLADHWKSLDAAFSQFSAVERNLANKKLTPWTDCRRVDAVGPLDPLLPPDEQLKMSVSLLLPIDKGDSFELFVADFVGSLLLNGHASPFYKALIESKIASEFSPNTGLDSQNFNTTFSVGVQGAKEADKQRIEEIIGVVLSDVVRDGFAKERTDSLLHQLEISLKHRTSSFGLGLTRQLLSQWFNVANPLDHMKPDEFIARLRKSIENPRFLPEFVQRTMLDNPCKFVFAMKPSKSFAEDLRAEEEKRLTSMTAELSDPDIAAIDRRAQTLKDMQEGQEDLSSLPSLALSNISVRGDYAAVEKHKLEISDQEVRWLLKGTGITYFRAISKMCHLPAELHPYLPLYTDCLRHLGLKQMSIEQLDELIRLKTGDISFAPTLVADPQSTEKFYLALSLSSFCLDGKVNEMIDLVERILAGVNFGALPKLETLIRGSASSSINSIADSGHSFATTFANQFLSPIAHQSETLSGLSQVAFINNLSRLSDLTDVVEKLKQIHSHAFKRDATRFFVTCKPSNVNAAGSAVGRFAANLDDSNQFNDSSTQMPDSKVDGAPLLQPLPKKQFVSMPFGVSFAAKGIKTVPYVHADSAKIQVLASFMGPYLHKEIREKGGAYGSGFKFAPLKGIGSFFTCRDPTPLRSLHKFQCAFIEAFEAAKASDLLEAKLGLFQRIDAPKAVSEEGVGDFASGLNPELRQQRREQILATTVDDLHAVADKYFVSGLGIGRTSSTIIGQIDDELKQSADWTQSDVLAQSSLANTQSEQST